MIDPAIPRFRELLARPLPGRAAQERMAPPWRHHTLEAAPGYRKAAVLALLYPCGRGLSFPLIVRTAGPGPHGGQIAFPGGALEAGETATEAALREAREEIGADDSAIEVIGQLTPFGVTSSRFDVTPVLAVAAEELCFAPSPAEVAECFSVPAAELMDDAAKGTAVVTHAGERCEVPCYRLAGRVVWGATAIALAELEEVLRLAEIRIC